MTLTQIVAATGLARRTAEGAVEGLLARGLALELPPNAAGRAVGRPARSFRFRSDAGYVLGLDVGVHRIAAILTDLSGAVRASVDGSISRTAPKSERIALAIDIATRCREQVGVGADDIWAATVGTPGVVDDSAYVSLCHVLPEWSEFSLADELAPAVPGKIFAENDTNLSAVAERWRGSAQGVDSVVWVLTGRRTGAGILIDGQPYRGADGAAGEIGWLPELGWARVSEQTLSFTGANRTRAGELAAATIRRARAGDKDARSDIETFAASIAPGLTALALVLNPECLVIGGAIATAGDLLIDAVADHMRPHCLRMPDLRLSTLGTDSVALGAIRRSLDYVESVLFSTSPAPAPHLLPSGTITP